MKTVVASLVLLAAGLALMLAAPPAGYYATAEGKAGAELRQALHSRIRNHRVIPYSSTTRTDTRDALEVLDRDPANSNNVILIYSGVSVPATTFGNTGWNREHLWPDSYGLDGVEPAYSDLHNLRACDANVNSARGNKYFDWSDPTAPSYKPVAHVEAPLCTTDADSWQPPASQRGDIARAMFYMVVRYTGDVPNEPTLLLTDNPAWITSTNAYMGKLSTLLQWHQDDPVDDAERLRNDLIHTLYQTNRNPFVDYPEWVNLTLAPRHTNAPVLTVAPAPGGVALRWLATNQSTQLEFATNLSHPWQTLLTPPLLTNGQFLVVWTNPGPSVFFRLRAW